MDRPHGPWAVGWLGGAFRGGWGGAFRAVCAGERAIRTRALSRGLACAMRLIYAGIDEAGYGPMLGPLVVAMAVFSVEGFDPEQPAPDLWDRLSRAVGRGASDAPKRVAIADSKKLKLPNQTRAREGGGGSGRHPLLHLERGVLGMLGAAGHEPGTDAELFELLGARLEPHAWYGGEAVGLPVAVDRGGLRLDGAALRRAMGSAGVELISLRCRVVGETGFNAGVRRLGSKAGVSGAEVGGLIAEALGRWGGDAGSGGGTALRGVVDRQGGRERYEGLIGGAVPGAEVVETARVDGLSRYEVRRGGAGAAVRFETGAEGGHLPVALASMAAKLVRELAMGRFNRYWGARIEGLRPTAGYVTDARRWLAEAGPGVSKAERAALVRLA